MAATVRMMQVKMATHPTSRISGKSRLRLACIEFDVPNRICSTHQRKPEMHRTNSACLAGVLSTLMLLAGATASAQSGQPVATPAMAQDAHALPLSGEAGDPTKVGRTIDVSINVAMRFTPDLIVVKAGETVRLSVKNGGPVAHEVVIGTMDELKAHGKMMRSMPTMDHGDDSSMMKLAKGQTDSKVWRFDKPGVVYFACMIPGHLENGMIGKIQIE